LYEERKTTTMKLKTRLTFLLLTAGGLLAALDAARMIR